MQAQFVKVPKPPETSFLIRDMCVPYFPNPFHFHPELELTYILQGTGTRFVGDNIDYFGEGDMVLVGCNLPHLWKNDEIYYQGDEHLSTRAIVLQFKEDFLRNEYGEIPELSDIKSILKAARQGLKITGETKKIISEKLLLMLEQPPIERVAGLLMILSALASSTTLPLLSSIGFSKAYNYNKSETERINRVYAHIIENFSDNISLFDVAKTANMTPTAFCRYFKNCTGKTFSAFLLETRLNYACKLLVNNDMNITEVAYSSGFNNISYFNKQFKRMTGASPLQYKKDRKENKKAGEPHFEF